MSCCVHCDTELPTGARYCHNCGKAVYQIQVRSPSWRLPVETGSLSRRFMDRELFREEQRGQEEEYLRNAENFVSVDPEAAALVLYGSEWMHGENIELSVGVRASPEADLKMSEFHATISP